MDTNLNSQTKRSGVLNVILHGAFAFIRKHEPERLQALIPAMPHHVFRAGNWLGDTNGNAHFIGIEAENTGLTTGPNAEPWPLIQMNAYRWGVAAILRKIGAGASMCKPCKKRSRNLKYPQ